jgi:2,3-bisphosphoglycerate-independent phosphoglycerate mutase
MGVETQVFNLEMLRECCVPTQSKIVMLVVDGLGGLAHPGTGISELETANLPNLDAMAQESACGLTTPVLPGVTPGSGPGHLALFGYDPLKYLIGRGALEALGIDVPLEPGDVAARGNFCTVDGGGLIVDRRAGRIPSEMSASLCKLLNRIELDGVQVDVFPVRDHRFVLRLRGEGLSDLLTESDPQQVGVPPNSVEPIDEGAESTARVVNRFTAQAKQLLAKENRANMVLLRGFAQLPDLPPMGQVYRLNAAGIAAYPMYRGLAEVVGMQVIPTGDTFADEIDTLHQYYSAYEFFFVHYKPADTAGEDGNFEGKVNRLEELDSFILRIRELNPDVFVVAGDHSTPAILAGHSWHPVPLMVHSRFTKGEGVSGFNERACAQGSIGRVLATDVMMLALAHAGKLTKFGP